MQKRGKKYVKASELVNKDMIYSIDEAIEMLEKTNTVTFDPTVEVHFNLALDPKYQDQMIRSTITLPHGTGKTVKVCVFNDKANNDEIKKLWVELIGWEELIEEIASWKVLPNFDVCVATPSMMRHLWKIARILGPKWLMPNPKTWTVSDDLVSAVKEIIAWKFEFKNDKQWNVHSIFGKLSFWKEKLKENLNKFLDTIMEVKPSWAKWKYINSIYVCNCMGPGIKIDITNR